MKWMFNLYQIALKKNKDLLVFPIVGAAMLFIQTIAFPSFDFGWLGNINAWVSSFIITFLTYMLFDMFLNRVPFFTEHKYLLAAISFVTSTFIGETLSYQLKENITWQLWLWAGAEYIFGFIILLISTTLGLSIGVSKAEKKAIAADNYYKETISKMSKADKRRILSFCNKAISINDETFELIVRMKSKEAIAIIKQDLLDNLKVNS